MTPDELRADAERLAEALRDCERVMCALMFRDEAVNVARFHAQRALAEHEALRPDAPASRS